MSIVIRLSLHCYFCPPVGGGKGGGLPDYQVAAQKAFFSRHGGGVSSHGSGSSAGGAAADFYQGDLQDDG